MRGGASHAILLLYASALSTAYQSTRTFDEASELYRKGSLAEAQELYRKVVEGYERPAPALRADAACNRGSVLLDLGDGVGALGSYKEALTFVPGHAWAHFNMGVLEQDAGDLEAAVKSYKAALETEPSNSEAMSNLGSCLDALGKYGAAADAYGSAIDLVNSDGDSEDLVSVDEASDKKAMLVTLYYAHGSVLDKLALVNPAAICGRTGQPCGDLATESFRRVLLLEPGHPLASHALASRLAGSDEKGSTLTGAPREYVSALFDGYAQSFDASLEGLGYSAPARLAEGVEQVLGVSRSGPKQSRIKLALDAGCGTGLLGPELRARLNVGKLVGVDLSEQMVQKARLREGVYDELLVGDIEESLKRFGRGGVDLIAAADVLVYMGDLRSLMTACAAALTHRGLLAFTTERLDSGNGEWQLQSSGRFAHSKAYVESLAEEAGLEVASYDQIVPRLELGKPIQGQLFVLVKNRR